MSDKVNVEEIIGLVKTDEVTNSVEEVRKLRGRENEKTEEIKEVIEDYFYLENDEWRLVSGEEDGVVSIVQVPVEDLLKAWESLVSELSSKEVKLLIKKEYIKEQSFKIEQETDFKEIYGKNNADIRKQHIKGELADVYEEVQGLELSINWIRGYVPLLRECIKVKRD